jgi:DNA mismatch repair protein MutH
VELDAVLMHDHMSGFDPRAATEQEILRAAGWLEGKTLAQIGYRRPDLLLLPSSNRTKHIPGHVYEGYFNIVPDSDPRPDFRGAAIELKSTGLMVRFDGGIGQKERVSLQMLGTHKPEETWATTALRPKLDQLLIVYYGYKPGAALGTFATLKVVRWQPSLEELDVLRVDWEEIHRRRRLGLPLSESYTRVLASSTKGPGRVATKTRGYSLKPRFVYSIYLENVGLGAQQSISMGFGGAQDFEDQVVHLLGRFVGRPLHAVANDLGLPPSASKNAEATTVRRILGLNARGRTKEFDQYGLEVKTVPITPTASILENLSFPAFLPIDLVQQEWAESDLLASLNRLLLVPLVRSRGTARPDATIGRATFWSPSPDLLDRIRGTWESYRERVAEGRPDDYPRVRDNLPIFVRSHGLHSRDRVPTLGAEMTMKRSFWLHPTVVKGALMRGNPGWRGF